MRSKKRIEEWIRKLMLNQANDQELQDLFRALRADKSLDSRILPERPIGKQEMTEPTDAFPKIWSKIESGISPAPSRRKLWQLPLVRVAAAIALLIAVGLTGSKLYQAYSHTEYVTRVGEIRTIQLSDGSSVVLNGNSTLKVKKNLSVTKPRNVYLTGEANFQISKARTAEARFIVHTRDLEVEVLGTRFNVNSRDRETVIYLEEGSVKVGRRDRLSQDIYMSPGEKVEFTSGDHQLKRIEVESEINEISWREGVFEFENLTLDKILKQITGPYDYSFAIKSPNLSDRTFTVRIPDNNLEFAISVLEKLTGTSITDQNGTLIIRETNHSPTEEVEN